jgi:nicotinate-nucleotide adenylyltransferase
VAAATAAIAELGLDELVITVAGDPQLKDPPVAPAAIRLEMARAAFAGLDRAVVSEIELTRPGPTYTVDTVEALLAAAPGEPLVLVVGADAAASMPRWHRADALARLATVAVVPRDGFAPGPPPGFLGRAIEMAPVDLSSTSVREALASGADPSALLPPGVVPVVLANRLYSP